MQMWSPSHKKMIPVGPSGQVCLSAEKERSSSIKKSPAPASSNPNARGKDCKKSLWFGGSDDITVTVVNHVGGNGCTKTATIEAGNDSSLEKNRKRWQSKRSKQKLEGTDNGDTEMKDVRSPYFVAESTVTLYPKPPEPRPIQNGKATRRGSNDNHKASVDQKKDSPVLPVQSVQLRSGDEIAKWLQDREANLGSLQDLKKENIPEIRISFPVFEKTEDSSLPIIMPLLEEGEGDEDDDEYNNPYIPSTPKCSSKQELEALNDMANPRPSTSRALRREMMKIRKAAAKRERLGKKGLPNENGAGASRVLHGATLAPQEVNENANSLSPTRRSSRVREPHPARSLVRHNLFPEGCGKIPRKRKKLEPEPEDIPQALQSAFSTTNSTPVDIGTEQNSTSEQEPAAVVTTPSPIKRLSIELKGRGVQVKKLKLTEKSSTDGDESPLQGFSNISNIQPIPTRTSRRIIARVGSARPSPAITSVKVKKVEVVDLPDDRNDNNISQGPIEDNLPEQELCDPLLPANAVGPMKMPALTSEQFKADRTQSLTKIPKLKEQDMETIKTTMQQLAVTPKADGSQNEKLKHQKSQKINGEDTAPECSTSSRTLRTRPKPARSFATPRAAKPELQLEATAETVTKEELEVEDKKKERNNDSMNISSDTTTPQERNSTDVDLAVGKKENGNPSSNGNGGIGNIIEELYEKRETRRSRRAGAKNVNVNGDSQGHRNVLPEIEIGRDVKPSPESQSPPVDSQLLETEEPRSKSAETELMDASKNGNELLKTENKPKADPLHPVVSLLRWSQSPKAQTPTPTGAASAVMDKQLQSTKTPKTELEFLSAAEPFDGAAGAGRPKSKSPRVNFGSNGRTSSSNEVISNRVAEGRRLSPRSLSVDLSKTGVPQSSAPEKAKEDKKIQVKSTKSKSCLKELRVSVKKLDPAKLKKKYPNLVKNKNNQEKVKSARTTSEGSSTETSLVSTPDQSTSIRRSGRAKKPARLMNDDQSDGFSTNLYNMDHNSGDRRHWWIDEDRIPPSELKYTTY